MQNRDSGLILSLVSIVGACVFVFIAWQLLAVPILNSPAVQTLIHVFGG
jgi:threonine/homoserine/homoserine lactone efflux protein